MRKINRIIMILASVLLSLVLITSSVLSGTFAKYVTGTKSASSNTGRVAKWGVTVTSGEHLETKYTEVSNNSFKVHTLGSTDVIAPGTSGSLAWFRTDGNPEVAFDVDFSGSIDIGRGFWSLEDVIDYARDQMFPALKGKTEAEKKEIVQAEIVQEIKNAIQTEIGSAAFDALTESALQQKINEKIDLEIIQDLGKAAYGALTIAERNDLIKTEAEVKAELGNNKFNSLTEEEKQERIKTEAEVITELGQTAFNKLTADEKDEKRAAKLLQKTNTRIAEKERDVLLSNIVKEKKEILLYDQDGKAIEYFPIIIYCVEYDMLNNGQMVERGRTCLTRTTLVKNQQGNVVLDDNGNELKDTHKYFGQHSFDSVTDMISALNGNVSEWALSRVFDDPYNAPNQRIDKVYAVEWHWPYSNTSDYPGKGSGSQGTYQTKELDGQLGEAVLKAPDMFNITLNMSVVIEQVQGKQYESFTEDGVKKIEFGSYPQSLVEDSALVSTLSTKAGTLPTTENSQNWTSYGYYQNGSNSEDYMWYIDVEEGGEKYRGVYFTSYRPESSYDLSSAEKSFQDDNSYSTGEVYWFEYEPITWTIIEETSRETAFILCDMIVDSQAFQNICSKTPSGGTIHLYNPLDNEDYRNPYGEDHIYANNYEYSTIRKWLNETFYETAFSERQDSIILDTYVDNSREGTRYADTHDEAAKRHSCANTLDKVFLLSDSEVYALTSKQRQATGYAKVQGLSISSDNGPWMLRTFYLHTKGNVGLNSQAVRYFNPEDSTYIGGWYVYASSIGVVPALWIRL